MKKLKKSANRLDYIDKFKDGTVESMISLRQDFIELESKIECIYDSNFSEQYRASLEGGYDGLLQIKRVAEECKKHLEVAQMYSIKFLCLIGEEKEEK